MTRVDELPDDPALLERLLREQREQLRVEHDALVERIRQEAWTSPRLASAPITA